MTYDQLQQACYVIYQTRLGTQQKGKINITSPGTVQDSESLDRELEPRCRQRVFVLGQDTFEVLKLLLRPE